MASRYFDDKNDIYRFFDEEEVDDVKAVMAMMLMENTRLEDDIIYSLVFGGGQNIIWH